MLALYHCSDAGTMGLSFTTLINKIREDLKE
jgi:hypothetical protein